MRVSIIIAVKAFNDFLKESLEHCLKLDYKDYEILVLPDENFNYNDTRVKIIPTGACLPAHKRDLASKHATGEILAFLDDDAYPALDWLKNAVENFKDMEVAAVGGPAITPPGDNFFRQVSGATYESWLVSGTFSYRYKAGKKQYIDDYPSCNLLVRKSIFDSIGGFQTKFWPGEDTILCLEITKKLNKKIAYDPDVLVFHHRRPVFSQHLKQILNYALHRGYFVKHFPQTSLKWQYFIPTAFLFWLIEGMIFSIKNSTVLIVFIASLLLYFTLALFSVRQSKSFKIKATAILAIFLTHITYGFYFLKGLLKKRLTEE